MSKTAIARSVGITTAGFIRERLSRTPLVSADQIPKGPEAYTLEWLTAALCVGVPGAAVTGFELGGRNDGTTARRPMTVTYNEAGQEAGLETALFTKSTRQYLSRVLLNLLDAVPTECEFYARIRPGLDVEAPTAYYVNYDGRDGRSLFITDDVMVTRGAEPGSPLRYIDRAGAESMVRQMASYHAAYWGRTNDPALAHLPLSDRWQAHLDSVANFEKQSLVGFERSAGFCPPELLGRGDEIYPTFRRAMERSVQGVLTFCHYDTHQGNWYQCADGTMGLYDWQANVKSRWSGDFAYAISSALTIEDRRAWERELIELYLEQLAERGVIDPPSFDEAWLDYRQQMFHGLIFWLFTIGQSRFNPNMQPRDVSEANCERMLQAVVDLDCLEAV